MPKTFYTLHVVLSPEQKNYLRMQAARRQLSVSALIRELVERDRANRQRAERREAGGK